MSLAAIGSMPIMATRMTVADSVDAGHAGGDWTLRGLDFETYLVGAVTDKIIDADRLARRELNNGFPGWILYRTFLCGDHHLRTRARDWCVAYAIAVAEAGAVRTGQPSEEMGCLAGWDAYYRLHNQTWLIAGHDVADVAGVSPNAYRKLRNRVYASIQTATAAYFVELQIAIRRVWSRDRFCEDTPAPPRIAYGNGFSGIDVGGDGNFIVCAAKLSDST